jgi:hypothetical protein
MAVTVVSVPPMLRLLGGVAVLLLFLRAGWVAYRFTPPKPHVGKIPPVQGLAAFGPHDEEIYSQLQRQPLLAASRNAITDPTLRLIVVCGPSGSGKTSFLRAGLMPALRSLNPEWKTVYIKCGLGDPEQLIRSQLIGEALLPSNAAMAPLADLLTNVQAPAVIMLDQFEQVLALAGARPFVESLKKWHGNFDPSTKLVVAVRDDYLGALLAALRSFWHPVPDHNSFFLEEFTPKQAASVLATLAQHAGIDVDRTVVEHLADKLRGPDQTVSPINVQILLSMIARERAEGTIQALTSSALERLGGLEGLLTNYIHLTLRRQPEPFCNRALHVLQALLPRSYDLRSSVLEAFTLDALLARLQSVEASQATEVLGWLSHSNVRLVLTTRRGDGATTYQLAHDSLIPVVRRLGAGWIADAELAQAVLRERIPLWLKDHDPRYLPTLREHRLIRRQLTSLRSASGTGQDSVRWLWREADAYLTAGERRWWWRFAAAVTLTCLASGAWFWWNSPLGIAWRAERVLATVASSTLDADLLSELARLKAMQGDLPAALRVAVRIRAEQGRDNALRSVGATLASMSLDDATGSVEAVLQFAASHGTEQDVDTVREGAIRTLAEVTRKEGDARSLTAIRRLVASSRGAARDRALMAAAPAFVRDVSELNVLRTIDDVRNRVTAMAASMSGTDASTATRLMSDACRSAEEITDSAVRQDVYRTLGWRIPSAYREHGQGVLGSIQHCLQTITSPTTRIVILARLAQETGEPAQAAAFFEHSTAIARGLAGRDRDEALVALIEVANGVLEKTGWDVVAEIVETTSRDVRDRKAQFWAHLAAAEAASRVRAFAHARARIMAAAALYDVRWHDSFYGPRDTLAKAIRISRCIECLNRLSAEVIPHEHVRILTELLRDSRRLELLDESIAAVRRHPRASEVDLYRLLRAALELGPADGYDRWLQRIAGEARRFEGRSRRAALLAGCAREYATKGSTAAAEAAFSEALTGVSAGAGIQLGIGRDLYTEDQREFEALGEESARLWRIAPQTRPMERLLAAIGERNERKHVVLGIARDVAAGCDAASAVAAVAIATALGARTLAVDAFAQSTTGAERCKKLDWLQLMLTWVSDLDNDAMRTRLYDSAFDEAIELLRSGHRVVDLARDIVGRTSRPLKSYASLAETLARMQDHGGASTALWTAVRHVENVGEGWTDPAAVPRLIDTAAEENEWHAAWRLANSANTTGRRGLLLAHLLTRYTQVDRPRFEPTKHWH